MLIIGAVAAVLSLCGQLALVDAVFAEGESRTSDCRVLPEHLIRPGVGDTGPNITCRRHTINKLRLNVTNWGVLGSMGGEIKDPLTGMKVLGAEYPAGSNHEYLKFCALWVGAVVGSDTAVSTAYDHFMGLTEFYPDLTGIQERSTRVDNMYYHEDAVSEQDFICTYTDTLTHSEYVPADFWSYRPHRPLGIRIRQESFAWSYEYAQDFVLIRYWLTNIGDKHYSKVWVGFQVHPEVGPVSGQATGYDPLDPPFARSGYHLGFIDTVSSLAGYGFADTMNIMWLADNDGDPASRSQFGSRGARSVLGFSIIGTPLEPYWNNWFGHECWRRRYGCSFNWWHPSQYWHQDWGPQRKPLELSLQGTKGEPLGDRHKYRLMAKGEIDYDQMWAAMDFSHQGWIGRPLGETFPPNLARGISETVGLLAGGPFDLPVGDSISIVLAVAAGEQFHTQPDNLRFLPYRPDYFYSRLDFSDLMKSMQWAKWMYDNPGKDTDGDGCRGHYFTANCFPPAADDWLPAVCLDTMYYAGDGIPDLFGLSSPRSPQVKITAAPGSITLTWDGEASETSYDYFSQRYDFEGYRVYLGLEYQPNKLSLVANWDLENYDRFRLTDIKGKKRWICREPPYSVSELAELYGDKFDPRQYPDKWSYFENDEGELCYFQAHSGNCKNRYAERDTVIFNPIQRVGADSLFDEISGAWLPYGKFSCTIDGLLPSQKYYLAVTAYDHGFPEGELTALESSVLDNLQAVYPLNPPEAVADKNLKIVVYPNPYRINAGYRRRQYEDPNREGFPERVRRINFTNLPPEATIRIFSLDGDLIRKLHHPDSRFSDSPSHMAWDVISRNTQAVVSGIYLYSVESAWGNQVGKLVIIK